MKKKFTGKHSNGENFYDVAMVFLIELECNPETKFGVLVLRDQISSATVLVFKRNIPDILEHIASTMDMIREMDETHDNLMKCAFDALLNAPNTVFHWHFQLEKMSWKGGAKMHNFLLTINSREINLQQHDFQCFLECCMCERCSHFSVAC